MTRSTMVAQVRAQIGLSGNGPQLSSAQARAGGYARMAERHWRRYRPAWMRVLEHEGRLGQELLQAEAKMVKALQRELQVLRVRDGVDSLPYLERVRWENAIRDSVEERLLPEIILLPPEVDAR